MPFRKFLLLKFARRKVKLAVLIVLKHAVGNILSSKYVHLYASIIISRQYTEGKPYHAYRKINLSEL
jgi:hypothetical protein